MHEGIRSARISDREAHGKTRSFRGVTLGSTLGSTPTCFDLHVGGDRFARGYTCTGVSSRDVLADRPGRLAYGF